MHTAFGCGTNISFVCFSNGKVWRQACNKKSNKRKSTSLDVPFTTPLLNRNNNLEKKRTMQYLVASRWQDELYATYFTLYTRRHTHANVVSDQRFP